MKSQFKSLVVAFISMVIFGVSVEAQEKLYEIPTTSSVSTTVGRVLDEVETLRTAYTNATNASKAAQKAVTKGVETLKVKKDAQAKLEWDLKVITTGVADALKALDEADVAEKTAKDDLDAAKIAVPMGSNPYANKVVREKDAILLKKIHEHCEAAKLLVAVRTQVGPTRRRLRKECEEMIGGWDKLNLVDAMKIRIEEATAEATAAETALGKPRVVQTYTVTGVEPTGLYKAAEDAEAAAKNAKAELEAAEARLQSGTDTLNGGEIRNSIRELKGSLSDIKANGEKTNELLVSINDKLVLIDGKLVKVETAIKESTEALAAKIDTKSATLLVEIGKVPVETKAQHDRIAGLLEKYTLQLTQAPDQSAKDEVLAKLAELKTTLERHVTANSRRMTWWNKCTQTWVALEPVNS